MSGKRFWAARRMVWAVGAALAGKRRRVERACRIEGLEGRVLLSAWFKYDVIVQSGSNNITGFGSGPSINDNGDVSFVGQNSVSDGIYVALNSAMTPVDISPNMSSSLGRTFNQAVQITNGRQVMAYERVSGATVRSFIQIWDGQSSSSYSTVATADSGGTGDFDAVFPYATMSNAGDVAFGALQNGLRVLATPGQVSGFDTFGMQGTIYPMAADNGTFVVRAGNQVNSPINLYDSRLSLLTTIADSSEGFVSLGQAPGISDDGSVVVFAGDRGDGPGVFARFNDGTGWGSIVRVAGERQLYTASIPELGYDDAGGDLYLSSFDLNSRISVVRKDLGVAGFEGDDIVVSYMATPNAASRTNPVTGKPMFFSGQAGLWSQRIDGVRQLESPNDLKMHANSPLPVMQVGDMIGGQAVTGISINDPLALAAWDDLRTTRTQRRGDHRLVFRVTTGSGQAIVRASHMDSDEDGLLDHWETAGIDMDGDGAVDLNLAAMGADPLKRDLFVECDWSKPRMEGATQVWSNEVPAGAVAAMVSIYGNAPSLSNGIAAGITLHFDGGSGLDTSGSAFSQNMGSGALHGGDLVGEKGTGKHLDVVYFGEPNSLSYPGVVTESYGEVKEQYFMGVDKGARELAFHYVVMADFQDFLNANSAPMGGTIMGFGGTTSLVYAAGSLPISSAGEGVVMMTSGAAAGQVRYATTADSWGFEIKGTWSVNPAAGDKFVFLHTSGGRAEVGWYDGPDNNAQPANDVLISLGGWGATGDIHNGVLADGYLSSRTIAHELGHDFGLRHGGVDHDAYKGSQYLSIMSYSYQLEKASTVVSYSGASDATFNDWENLRMDFQNSLPYLGRTNDRFALGASVANVRMDDMTVLEYRVLNGISSNQAPTVSNVNKSVNQSFPLTFSAAAFSGTFSDPDAGDTLQTVKVVTLPGHGTLALNSVAVTAGQEIAVGLLGKLVYTPDAGFSGSDSFDWNGSDGTLYAATAATVNVTVNRLVPTVYLMNSVATVYEATANSGGKGKMLLYRVGGNISSPLAVSYSVGGTGVDGVNYSHLSGTVTFLAGKSTATIDVIPVEDGVADATLTVSATLTADANFYAVHGTYKSATVSIVDDSPTVYLFNYVPTVLEATANSGGKGKMMVYRTGSTVAPLTVEYTVGGTGVDGVNYSHLSGSVTFLAGKSTATIDVVPLEDGIADATLTVSAALAADAGNTYHIHSSYKAASVNIVDDSPTVYLMKSVPVVKESAANSGGKGQMLLYRTGSTAGPLTVSYTVGGTGVDSVNYAHLGGTATFLAGKSTATIDVLPVEDGKADAALTVSATLIADGGPTYHVANAYKTAVVSIIDSAPTIYMWVSKPYAYKSGKGNGQFAVYRTGSTAGQLTVNYSVLNGSTGVSGTNFTALTGQVTFGPGESMAYIDLVGINDPNQVGYLTVKVGLVVDGGPSYRFGSTYSSATGYVLNA